MNHDHVAWVRPMTVAGQAICICYPEDLIMLKVVSNRPRDREDVAGIIHKQMAKLDLHYLDLLVEGPANDMGRPDLLDFSALPWRRGLTALPGRAVPGPSALEDLWG